VTEKRKELSEPVMRMMGMIKDDTGRYSLGIKLSVSGHPLSEYGHFSGHFHHPEIVIPLPHNTKSFMA
jgi:hypothetical protein